jgi:hypothetical protein
MFWYTFCFVDGTDSNFIPPIEDTLELEDLRIKEGAKINH